MPEMGACSRCRKYAYLPDDEHRWCAECVKKAKAEAKAARLAEQSAARDSGRPRLDRIASFPEPDREFPTARAPRSDRIALSRDEPLSALPVRPSEARGGQQPAPVWSVDHPLLGQAWEESLPFFASVSSSARHHLLDAVRQAARQPDPWVEVEGLHQRLRSSDDPARSAADEALQSALAFRSEGLPAVLAYIQALVAYADFRETLRVGLPAITVHPDADGHVTAEWLVSGAHAFARDLSVLDASPVRQVLSYLRGLERAGAGQSDGRRTIAMLLPLAAASAARGVKNAAGSGRAGITRARLRLLELVRWAVERTLDDPDALIRLALPAVEALVAYHGFEREQSAFRRRRDHAGQDRPAAEPEAPSDYLSQGYLDRASGAIHISLLGDVAAAWAAQMRAGRNERAQGDSKEDVTASQFRRFFGEIRRLETLSHSRLWPEVRPQVIAMAPLAADAVARGLKAGKDYRALRLLVERNVAYLHNLPEEIQLQAFQEGMVPHFEAILAHFNARRAGMAPIHAVPALNAGDMTALQDADAFARAIVLHRGKISPSLLRRIYAHCRDLENRDPAVRPAEVARLVALTDDALRRSEGDAAGRSALRQLVRQAQGLSDRDLTHIYLPHFESVIAWFVGLSILEV